jgi:BirA family biotin operon repressor/biotin-[acetyl-CoA-carboxylase] ligase
LRPFPHLSVDFHLLEMLNVMMARDRIAVRELQAFLRPGGPWGEVVCLDTTDSTNGRAADLAEKGAPHGTVVVAESQTAGRGRLGRRWVSPPGSNIYVSILLRPEIPNAEAPRLSLVTGVALADAVEASGVPGFLKWPNDLYLGGRKAAGILAEMASGPDRVRYVVAGVGINVNLGEDEIPGELRGKATSLRIHAGRAFPRVALLARFLDALAVRYREFLAGGFPAVRPGWERRDFLLGRRVLFRFPEGEAWGVARGVDGEAALLFQRDGSDAVERVHSGEIVDFTR